MKWLLSLVAIAVVATQTLFSSSRDGQTDIYWHNEQFGHSGVWFMNGTAFDSAAWITNTWGPQWRAAAVADFDQDGWTDLVVRNSSTGENGIWLMNGAEPVIRQRIASSAQDLRLIGAADLNSDTYADLIWQKDTSAFVWFMESTNWTGEVGWIPKLPSPDWEFAVPGDFDNDGYVDLVARDRMTGSNAIWFLRGTNRLHISGISAERDLSYRPVAAGVFNPLGHTDLLWRSTNGSNQLWRMQGTRLLEKLELRHEPSTNWVIIGAGGYTNVPLLSATSAKRADDLVLNWRFGPPRPDVIYRTAKMDRWMRVDRIQAASHFTNRPAARGVPSEYKIGTQYLFAGSAIPPVEHRGTVILVVDRTVARPLGSDLETLRRDLVGDGWDVIRTNAARHNDIDLQENIAAVASIKQFITNVHQATAGDAKAVLLVGHVAVPYSGFHSPDGHGGRALPADGYYGDVDGRYTDSTIDFRSFLQAPYEPRHDNRPGDGKWDQQSFPTNAVGQLPLEMAVGRIDFAQLPAFRPKSELDLLRAYLRKNHRYRHKQLEFPDRVLTGDYLPTLRISRMFHNQALSYAYAWFGPAPAHIAEGDLFLSAERALWSFHAGWGLSYGVVGRTGDYHTTDEIARGIIGPRAAFSSLWGSYFLDWGHENNLLRATLADENGGLGAMWFNPARTSEVGFQSLGLGEPIAKALISTANTFHDINGTPTYFSFLGDPTLRLQILEPPSHFTISGAVPLTISWRPSAEASEYHLYLSTDGWNGPWKPLVRQPSTRTNFVHRVRPPGHMIYQLRAAALTHTGSGSFTNLSQGIFLQVVNRRATAPLR